jgi:uncharacterized protein DUF4926
MWSVKDRPIRELDVVALTEDIPAKNLLRGQVGTVVHVYSPGAFEVEFVDNEGRTYGLATLSSGQLFPLLFEPIAA